jgi:hypothetical protein
MDCGVKTDDIILAFGGGEDLIKDCGIKTNDIILVFCG